MNAFTIPKQSQFTSPKALQQQVISENGKKAGRIRHQQTQGTVFDSKPVKQRSA